MDRLAIQIKMKPRFYLTPLVGPDPPNPDEIVLYFNSRGLEAKSAVMAYP